MPKLSKIEKKKLYGEMFKKMTKEVIDVIILYEKLVENSEDLDLNYFQHYILDLAYHIVAGIIVDLKFKTQEDQRKSIQNITDSFSKYLPKLVKSVESAEQDNKS